MNLAQSRPAVPPRICGALTEDPGRRGGTTLWKLASTRAVLPRRGHDPRIIGPIFIGRCANLRELVNIRPFVTSLGVIVLIHCIVLARFKDAAAGPVPATASAHPQNVASTGAASRPSTRPAVSSDVHAVIIRFLEDRVRRDPDDITAPIAWPANISAAFGKQAMIGISLFPQPPPVNRFIPFRRGKFDCAAQARALFALHGFAAARDMGLQLVNQESDKCYPFQILGDALLELGDDDAAADAYKKMDAFDDPDANTETRMARLALIRGDTEQARRRLESAADLRGRHRRPAPDVVAWCLVQGGQLAFDSGDGTAPNNTIRPREANPARLDRDRSSCRIACGSKAVQRVGVSLRRARLARAASGVVSISRRRLRRRWARPRMPAWIKSVGEIRGSGRRRIGPLLSPHGRLLQRHGTRSGRGGEVGEKGHGSSPQRLCLRRPAWALYKAGDIKPAVEAMNSRWLRAQRTLICSITPA